ncbi:hypothetical protein B7P43_G10491 [Cryptotermes secundus]|nr:uncharacterized protein LOC111873600 isoform X2 [Cryptotermes secundus]PNF16387.1 hypothetical protein B7P43_G10491 [Cryptotermes secundus]
MDLDVTFSSAESDLIMLLDKNCEEVEQLALETVARMDMPILNSLRELTKGDCWQILEKHQDIFSIVEQALVLSGLTDYITCAAQNELFHTFRKKADRRGLQAIFIHLSRKWVRFFDKLGPYDLTCSQLKSVLFLLRQSLQRLPETYQRSFFSCALAMGESSLKKAEEPPQYYPVTFIGVKATQCAKQVTSVHKADTEIQNYCNDTVVCQKTAAATNRTSEEKNCCVKPKDLRPAASKATTSAPRRKLSSIQQSVTAARLIESTKGPVKSAHQKTQIKYKSDITKYMVKAQKDKLNDTEMAECSESLNDPLNEGKENQKMLAVSSPAGSNLDSILKEQVTHATPTGKSYVVIDVDSPTKKMRVEERKATNAFELMMEQSRSCNRQGVKRRSLFQHVNKAV